MENNYGIKKIVLVVTSSIDYTATYIIEKYKNKANFFRINVDRFMEYNITIRNGMWSIQHQEEKICNKEVYAIYYRKPMLPDLNEYNVEYHIVIQRDIIAIINGIVDSFDGPVLTKPFLLRRAENKAFQLLYNKPNSCKMPKSYMGNDIESVLGIANGDIIIKPISVGKIKKEDGFEIYQTAIWDKNIINEISDIKLTPIYTQEYVAKKYEARITIIGTAVFGVSIISGNKVDWRADYRRLKYKLIDIPNEIRDYCFQLMKIMELEFGAFDFIITEEDEWFFLEVNPNGQWLWLEEELGINISEKIVDYLLGEKV